MYVIIYKRAATITHSYHHQSVEASELSLHYYHYLVLLENIRENNKIRNMIMNLKDKFEPVLDVESHRTFSVFSNRSMT